jgi:type IV pilus assembly protein PilM
MAKIQPVWALDIGQAALKALKLMPGDGPDQVVAEAFDYVEYPKILSQPDADPDQLVREALETFLERNDLKGCKVTIAVPGQAGLVKFIKLPPVEKKRIPDIVKFEARQQIPFALEEVVWSYQQIGDEDEGGDEEFTMAEVGLFAMKRDQINRAILPFRVAGIEVDVVQMGPIALYNFITFDQLKGGAAPAAPAPEGEGEAGEAKAPAKAAIEKGASIVLLDIGADNTDLIITDGTRIWQRNVPIGGNHFTRALTKELKLTFAKAEHLKRNATKAPDPRSIFTAMRGVFNDFASEINRSIGFYSSVNRTAKIAKVVGLGNGFKLPGLQKFLQQNINHDVERLEGFNRLAGEDVRTAPQFQENVLSFAVAYGLGLQGLGKSQLRTNLLPPEIEQVRLIRAKKPWALIASALILVGFASLFWGDYKVLAKVDTTAFKEAVADAKNISTKGAGYKAEFDKGKSEWETEFNVGKLLVVDPADRGKWPALLKTINSYMPNPAKEYHLDPTNPRDTPKLDQLRVYIDAIKPAYRTDVMTGWFQNVPARLKNLMHPYDREKPPSGAGWVIQLIGHHYNPDPSDAQLNLPENDPKRYEFGPFAYLYQKVMPRLLDPRLRINGIHHVTLAWVVYESEWTPEKGSKTNNLSSSAVPILARATPPAESTDSGTGMSAGPMGNMKMGMASGYGDRMQMQPGMMSAPGGAMMGMGMRGPMSKKDDTKQKMVMLQRTDFLIQFLWQPDPATVPKTQEDMNTKVAEILKELNEAEKTSVVKVPPKGDIKEIVESSKQMSEAVTKEVTAPPAAAGTPSAAPAGGIAPAAGAPTGAVPPVATPK